MDEGKEMAVRDEMVQLGTLRVSGPADVIRQASAVAQQLAAVIKDRKLYSKIQGREFVRVEGWTTLGAMLGIIPREASVTEREDGYEAVVELVRMDSGAVVGRGSAVCLRDEKTWRDRATYAIRSMAITRATGKAFRLGFSWIMTLAGYEPTPAEEMDEITVKPEPRQLSSEDPRKAALKDLGAVLQADVFDETDRDKARTACKGANTQAVEALVKMWKAERDKRVKQASVDAAPDDHADEDE